MIPKKLHLCWLSGDEFPPLIEFCVNTWKKVLPEYEIVVWDKQKFNLNSHPWVKSAFDKKKYAFAADYIRFYALYTEGGIYLDSDVEVIRSFDSLLLNKAFIGFEASTGDLEAAVVGAEKGMEWCKNILDFYANRTFETDSNGGVDPSLFAPQVVRRVLNDSGVIVPDSAVHEIIEDTKSQITFYPSTSFSPIEYDKEKSYNESNSISLKYYSNPQTYCIHRFNASWGIKPSKKVQLIDYAKKKLVKLFGKAKADYIIQILRKFL